MIRLITATGAHGTGKTTVLDDLEDRLSKTTQAVIRVPSVSTVYANQLSEKMGRKLTYDEINALGMREEMQYQLPIYLLSMLRHALRAAVGTLVMAPATGRKVEIVNILVDRWFSDIAVYNLQENVTNLQILQEPKRCCDELEEGMRKAIGFLDIEVKVIHFLTTVSASEGFQVDEEKFRANTDPTKWEEILGHVHHTYAIGSSYALQAGSRDERVRECLSIL